MKIKIFIIVDIINVIIESQMERSIRESLKQVGRMAYVIAKDVTLTPYCKEVFRKNRRLYKWGDR